MLPSVARFALSGEAIGVVGILIAVWWLQGSPTVFAAYVPALKLTAMQLVTVAPGPAPASATRPQSHLPSCFYHLFRNREFSPVEAAARLTEEQKWVLTFILHCNVAQLRKFRPFFGHRYAS